MTHAPRRRTNALPPGLLLLFALLALIALPSHASSQTVVNPRIVEFTPSADHDTVLPDGRPAVERYLLKVFQVGASQPFHTVDMGKPDADADGTVRFDFWDTVAAWPLPGGDYVSRVDAVGPAGNGLSAPSNPFTFSTACSVGLTGPTSASFPAEGGGGSVSVEADDGCDWTATATVGWIHLAAGGGTGGRTIIFNVDPNPNTTTRTGRIDVAGSTFTVTQAGVACSYTVSPASASIGASAGSGSFTVSSPTGCSWTATSNASWITLGTTSGSGNRTVSYSVAANSSTSSRTGTVTVGGKTFTITQAGVACTYTVSPASASVGASTGSGSFTVNCPGSCSWTATSNASWLTLGAVRSGSGTGTVSYTVAANSSTSSRTGTVTVGGKTFTITQAGAAVTCTYTLSPSSASFGASTSSGSFTINCPGSCSWTATSNASWITLGAVRSGSGSGTVSYTVAANSSTSSRTGTVTVAGRTFTITQAGAAVTCTYTVSPASASVGASAGSGSFTVNSPTGCSWTATSNVTWITLGTTSGSGTGTVSYSVAANTGTSSRTGTVTAGGKTFSVTQAGAAVTPPPASPLPSPWQHRDIGLVGRAGDATVSSGVFNVSGAGTGLAGNADAFHFAYRNAATEVIAGVTSVSDDCPGGRAGVMLRENLGPSTRYVAIVALPQGGFEVLHRVTPNSRASVVARVSQGMLGYLRLVSGKKTITVYRSDNGTSWTQVATVNTKFTPTLGGLAVTSGSGNLVNTAAFTQVTVR